MARERYLHNAGEDTIHSNEIKLVTAKDKRKNWWYYHKFHLLIGIIAAALVGNFIYSIATKVEPDYTIALLTSYSMPQNGITQLEECIAPYADDRNGDGKVVVQVSNYVFSQDTSDYTQQEASLVRFIADASENQSMIYLHDEDGLGVLAASDNLEGFFQYLDGMPMPEGADDFENAMLSWEEVKAFDEFVPQAAEGDAYDPEILKELYGRLRVSLRAAEGSSIERDEKDLAYYEDCVALLQRLKDGEALSGGVQAGENSVSEEG